MKHAAGWHGDEHAELSTQTNQAVVYVSGRTHTHSLSPHALRSMKGQIRRSEGALSEGALKTNRPES